MAKLLDKEILFCRYYKECLNHVKAYQKAYECSYEVAKEQSYKLISNKDIKHEIDRLAKEEIGRKMLNAESVFQQYVDIAFADITDFIYWEKDKKGKWCIRLRDSSEVDGSLIKELVVKKDSIKIKLCDKLKALEWLSDRLDMLTAEKRIRFELEAYRLGLSSSETKVKEHGNEGIDEFLQAIK